MSDDEEHLRTGIVLAVSVGVGSGVVERDDPVVVAPGEGVEDGPDAREGLPRTGVGKLEGLGEELLAFLRLARLGRHEAAPHDRLLAELGGGGAGGERLEPFE